MFRFLKSLISRPGTSTTSSVLSQGGHAQDEARVALSALATFDSDEFYRRTGYRIRNEDYFLQAVVHRSFLQLCPPGITRSNERLEFLGDSILNLIVAEYLYNAFPEAEEGTLSKRRARLVSSSALAETSKRIRLKDFLLMSPSALDSIRSGSDSILVDALEAFLAAMYLDGGFEEARNFVVRHHLGHIPAESLVLDQNYKSRLLEYTQGHRLGIPRYTTVSESGPDHNPVFTVEVAVHDTTVGVGKGGNKKSAEQSAAAQALEYFEGTGT